MIDDITKQIEAKNKVLKTINSCHTKEHFDTAKLLVANFKKEVGDFTMQTEVEQRYNYMKAITLTPDY